MLPWLVRCGGPVGSRSCRCICGRNTGAITARHGTAHHSIQALSEDALGGGLVPPNAVKPLHVVWHSTSSAHQIGNCEVPQHSPANTPCNHSNLPYKPAYRRVSKLRTVTARAAAAAGLHIAVTHTQPRHRPSLKVCWGSGGRGSLDPVLTFLWSCEELFCKPPPPRAQAHTFQTPAALLALCPAAAAQKRGCPIPVLARGLPEAARASKNRLCGMVPRKQGSPLAQTPAGAQQRSRAVNMSVVNRLGGCKRTGATERCAAPCLLLACCSVSSKLCAESWYMLAPWLAASPAGDQQRCANRCACNPARTQAPGA